MIEIQPVVKAHVAELVVRLRAREAAAFATLAQDPQQKIWGEVLCSLYSYAVLRDGEVAAIFGARAMPLSSKAYIWLICTDLCEEYPLTFLRTSRKVFAMLLERFTSVEGLVLCDFERSVRWLRWLGCDIHGAEDGVRVFVKAR